MTLLSDQKTQVRVGSGAPPYEAHVAIELFPVLTGTRCDQYVNVKLWLTREEAAKLRDDLTRQLDDHARKETGR